MLEAKNGTATKKFYDESIFTEYAVNYIAFFFSSSSFYFTL